MKIEALVSQTNQATKKQARSIGKKTDEWKQISGYQ